MFAVTPRKFVHDKQPFLPPVTSSGGRIGGADDSQDYANREAGKAKMDRIECAVYLTDPLACSQLGGRTASCGLLTMWE
jgi:hypothetical protein